MPTPHVTTMDMHGMEWSLVSKDRETHYISTISPPYRFADAILGRDNRAQLPEFQAAVDIVPDHFNYPKGLYFGNNYISDRYLVLTQYSKIIYSTVFKPIGRFNEDDFIRLKSDQSVQYLYSNGECEVYYICSTPFLASLKLLKN